jgi:hypothetical protein
MLAGSVLGSEWDGRCVVCGALIGDSGWEEADLVTTQKACDGDCSTVVMQKQVTHDDGTPDQLVMFISLPMAA